ncbi:hypothetical protein A9K55_001767 [Cordyceps militaris]|uniref:Uncharacterized protein n=1 Tax=Cordyceps militaris TaxID=73501 RepID=A0A2H4SSD8_CORMI|nr:hypothetical protein A9K55_001767 [Cordyceps militaris]
MYRFLQVAKASTKAILHGEMKGDRGLRADKDAGAGPRKILNEPRDTTCIRGGSPFHGNKMMRVKEKRRRAAGGGVCQAWRHLQEQTCTDWRPPFLAATARKPSIEAGRWKTC